jgi:hypothetical protein
MIIDECGVPVRLETTGGISTVVPGKWYRRALATGIYLVRNIGFAACERLLPLQYFSYQYSTIRVPYNPVPDNIE